MKMFFANLWNDDSGQDMAEYAIMLGVIAAVTVTAVTLLGTTISGMFTKIETAITGN